MFSFDLAENAAAATAQQLVFFLLLILPIGVVGWSARPSLLQRRSVYTRSLVTWRRLVVAPLVSAAF